MSRRLFTAPIYDPLFENPGATGAGVDIDDDDLRRLNNASLTSAWTASGDYQFPEELGAAHHLAVTMIAFGEMREAEARMECILNQAQIQYGTSHEWYAVILGTLAAIVQFQGRYSAARKLLQQCLSILDETRGPEHVRKVRPLTFVGLGFHAEGDDSAAVAYYQHALPIIEKNMGPDHKDAEPWRALIEEASRR